MGFVDRLVWVGEALGRALDRPRYRIDDAGHLLTERKKVDTAVRMLLEDGLKEVERGGLRVYCDRCTQKMAIAFSC